MKTRLSTFFLILSLALVVAAPAFAAVGEVVLARNDVRGTLHSGPTKALVVGDGLSLGLRVETGADSAAKMTFDPSGSLTLGAKARLVIDQNVVDQATGRSDSSLSVLAGAVRLALGKLFHGEVAIDTPTAVVGVKGTDLRVDVDEASGATTVAVSAGQRTFVAPGRAPELPSPILPGSGTLSASAGGPAFTLPQASFPETPLGGVGGVILIQPTRNPNGQGFVP